MSSHYKTLVKNSSTASTEFFPLRQSPRKRAMVAKYEQTGNSLELLAAVSMERAASRTQQKLFPMQQCVNDAYIDEVSSVHPCQSSDMPRTVKETEPVNSQTQQNVTLSKRQLQNMAEIPLAALRNIAKKRLGELFSEEINCGTLYSNKILIRCQFYKDGRCDKQFVGYNNTQLLQSIIDSHISGHISYIVETEGSNSSFVTSTVQYRRKQAALSKKKKSSDAADRQKSTAPYTALKSNTVPRDAAGGSDGAKCGSFPKISEISEVALVTSRRSKRVSAKTGVKLNDSDSTDSSTVPADSSLSGRCPARPVDMVTAGAEESVKSEQPATVAAIGDDCAVAGEQSSRPFLDHDYCSVNGELPAEAAVTPSSDGKADTVATLQHCAAIGQALAQTVSGCLSHGGGGTARCGSRVSDQGSGYSMSSVHSTVKQPDALDIEQCTAKQQNLSTFPRSPFADCSAKEKALALNYIHELHDQKKRKKVEYRCKICPDGRLFTAGATLLYHYRSHACIKPYQCPECNKTFTRQHSKNYHMMIHRDESRFTCRVCQKKFRHPSHFTEHKRKHTGETPFKCEQCKSRFKTRNTYKRHLKTRHGKILTANGIRVMTLEEFGLVKTRQYSKKCVAVASSHLSSGEHSPVSTVPHSTFSDANMSEMSSLASHNSSLFTEVFSSSSFAALPANGKAGLPPVSSLLSVFNLPAQQPFSNDVAIGMAGLPVTSANQSLPASHVSLDTYQSVSSSAFIGQPVNMLAFQAPVILSSALYPQANLSGSVAVLPQAVGLCIGQSSQVSHVAPTHTLLLPVPSMDGNSSPCHHPPPPLYALLPLNSHSLPAIHTSDLSSTTAIHYVRNIDGESTPVRQLYGSSGPLTRSV